MNLDISFWKARFSSQGPPQFNHLRVPHSHNQNRQGAVVKGSAFPSTHCFRCSFVVGEADLGLLLALQNVQSSNVTSPCDGGRTCLQNFFLLAACQRRTMSITATLLRTLDIK